MNYERIDAFAGKTLKIFLNFFPAFTRNRIMLSCCLLHDFIKVGHIRIPASESGLAGKIQLNHE